MPHVVPKGAGNRPTCVLSRLARLLWVELAPSFEAVQKSAVLSFDTRAETLHGRREVRGSMSPPASVSLQLLVARLSRGAVQQHVVVERRASLETGLAPTLMASSFDEPRPHHEEPRESEDMALGYFLGDGLSEEREQAGDAKLGSMRVLGGVPHGPLEWFGVRPSEVGGFESSEEVGVPRLPSPSPPRPKVELLADGVDVRADLRDLFPTGLVEQRGEESADTQTCPLGEELGRPPLGLGEPDRQ